MKIPLSECRILVAEDEFLILMMIEEFLADLGFEHIQTATAVPQALKLLDEQLFDAAMIDLNLRDASSYKVADVLIARGIPFFFSTGNGAADIKHEYSNYLALRKPFKASDLNSMFANILQ